MGNISLAQVFLNDEIRQAVAGVIESGQYILGKECRAFE